MKLPEGFILGSAHSSWQTEGHQMDGKKSQIMWMYENSKDVWHNSYGPDKSIKFWDNMKNDVAHYKQCGLNAVRFSLDWSKFLDDLHTGTVNEEYASFYDDYIDELISVGIEPMICLEHFDIPYELYEKYDGYSSNKVADLFALYADKVFERYSGKVKTFWTFNEPVVIPQLCFLEGFWYPNEKNPKKAIQWMYVKALASAKAVKIFKEKQYPGEIGLIANLTKSIPRDANDPEDLYAASVSDALYWQFFTDSAVLGTFPQVAIDVFTKENIMFEHTDDELAIIKENTVDILGINYYHPFRVKKSEENKNGLLFDKYFNEYTDCPDVTMNVERGWEIYPKSLYDIAMYIKEEYNNCKWMVTENGFGKGELNAKRDANGEIIDDYRINFVYDHLSYLLKAIDEGANCHGYMLWATIDNLSPVNAMKNRYGLIEVNIDTYERKLKQSGRWFNQMQERRELFNPFDIGE